MSETPTCFVIMPITTPASVVDRYGSDREHFIHVLDHLFGPAVERAEHRLIRPISEGSDLIHAEIVRNLEEADLVLCDISTLNANVFFELGIRTALNRATCLVRDEHTSLPFDTGGLNFHTYRCGLNPWHIDEDVEKLAAHIKTTVERSKGKNALWQQFGLSQTGVRAEDAGASVDKLDLILSQVQQLQRFEPRREGSLTDSAASGIEAVLDSLGVLDYELSTRVANDIALQLRDATLSDDAKRELHTVANRYGRKLKISFVETR